MSFLIDIREELDDQIQKQLRKFRQECAGTGYNGWYRIQAAIAKARDLTIYHDKIENYIMPNLLMRMEMRLRGITGVTPSKFRSI